MKTSSSLLVSRTRRRAQRGGALLAVMWLSAALAAIGFAVATRVRAETDHVSTEAEGMRAHYLATGSVERAIQWMIWGPTTGPNGQPRFWRQNDQRLRMTYPSGDVVVEMIPESSKLSINRGTTDELTRVISAITRDAVQARNIAAAIIDWRGGGGGTGLGNGVGAGNTSGASGLGSYYSQLGQTFQPPHASFREIEELLFVRGVTPELFYGNFVSDGAGQLYPVGGLRDALSVWGSSGPYNVNAASPAVLESVGLSPAAIQWILERRQFAPIEQVAEIPGVGAAASRLTTFGVRIWTLRATARLRLPDGSPSDVVRTASATVKQFVDPLHSVMPVHVLRFNENEWSQFALAPPAVPLPGGLLQ